MTVETQFDKLAKINDEWSAYIHVHRLETILNTRSGPIYIVTCTVHAYEKFL